MQFGSHNRSTSESKTCFFVRKSNDISRDALKQNANGTQMEHTWCANGTQRERKWNANDTTRERKWNTHGTEMEHRWHSTVAGIARRATGYIYIYIYIYGVARLIQFTGLGGTKVTKAQWSGHQGSKPTLLHPTPAEPRRAETRMSRVEPRHELWYGTGLGGTKVPGWAHKVYVLCERGRKKSRYQSTGLGGTKVPGWEGPKYRAGLHVGCMGVEQGRADPEPS